MHSAQHIQCKHCCTFISILGHATALNCTDFLWVAEASYDDDGDDGGGSDEEPGRQAYAANVNKMQ